MSTLVTLDVLRRISEVSLPAASSARLLAELSDEIEQESVLPPEAVLRIPTTLKALSQFAIGARRWSLANLFGLDFFTQVAHGLFGWDLRLTLLTSQPPRRILLTGETGVGKERVGELIGETLAALSAKTGGARKYRVISAAEFPDELFESELFGHLEGSYTGAIDETDGVLAEVAGGGALFLDEIGSASARAQSKLLRVVQSGEFRKVGATKPQKIDFHLVTATNESDRLRDDLRYRLAQPRIEVPSVRERVAALGDPHRVQSFFAILVDHVIRELNVGATKTSADALNTFLGDWSGRLAQQLATHSISYSWPGNLREVNGVIRQVLYEDSGDFSNLADLLSDARAGIPPSSDAGGDAISFKKKSEKFQRDLLDAAARSSSSIEEIATKLRMTRQTASRHLRRFGLTPPGRPRVG